MGTDNFAVWLMKQVDRQNIIGDLATYLVNNGLLGDSPNYSYEYLRGHLIVVNSDDNVLRDILRALKAAHEEWKDSTWESENEHGR